MKPQQLALFVGLSLSALSATTLSSQVLASQANSDKTAFSDAYQSYLTAVKKDENVEQSAKLAYTTGLAFYGDKSDNTANLAINYAKAITAPSTISSKKSTTEMRYDLYSQAYTILANNHGKNAVETLDALIGKAENTNSANQADNDYDRVIDIAKAQNNPKFVADMQFEAASLLANKFTHKKYHKAKALLNQADDYYRNNLDENTVERIKADFLMASFAQGRKKYKEAIERLNHVVTVFDNNLSFDHSAELTAHSKLVNLYEKIGQSEQATKHCLAIAKMVPWKKSQEQTPIYRQNPEYPQNKARQMRDGIVVVEFDVDTAGFVKNPEVVSSEGGKEFERSALTALKKWRYAPKFENGQPVIASTQVQLDFKIAR
ncbi:TonB family protein [Pseudoalteromonas agarivorans]|uniref:TonB family protein n=1 Tax=Pseudoalteromonas agarivorans TaxID=176102 RepID=UPI00311DCA62